MTDFRAKYKQKGISFGDPERSRITRAGERDERRKELRAQNFSKLRPLNKNGITETPGKSAAAISRNEKLQKWKQEKEMKKKTEKKVVKPPFKVGVVHHRVFSPPINSSGPSCSHSHSHSHSNVKSRVQQTSQVKRITRATEKRLAAKAAARAAAKAAEKKSFAPANYKFRPPAGLPNIPFFGRVKKGSIDATKLSWNFNTEEAPDSLPSQRKKSKSIIRESPRRSKKFKTSHKEDESMNLNLQIEEELRLSGSDKRRASNSSIDSISLRVSSDDPEMLDSPIAESSCINVDMQNKGTALREMVKTSTQPTVGKVSPPISEKKSPSKLRFISPTQKESQSDLEDINAPVLEINSSHPEKGTAVQEDFLQKADEVSELPTESDPKMMDSFLSESTEKPLDDSMNPAFFSPYVVTRRGKKEARKEQQIRRRFGQSPEEIPTKDTIMQSLNISIEEEKRTSQYFKYLIESETNRLQELCDHWTDIVSIENPLEEAQYIVQQAVGQTKLLLSKKFKRFESLVLDCERGDGQMLVTCKDLQGFWDIVYMEIKNCEDRFRKLEELKNRGWKEEDEMKKPAPKRLARKKSPKKSPKKGPAKSSLRALILAARQKKKEMEENLETKPADQEVVEIWKNIVRDSPTKIPSAKRKSSNTPQRLIHKERRTSFPLAVMAISQKCKTPEDKTPEAKISLETQVESEMETEDAEVETVNVQVQLDESISYINSKQTPGKSILKRIKVESTSDASDDSRLAKSMQKVIFNDNVELNEVEVDGEEKTKASLAEALARIDSAEFGSEFVPEMEIRAERKLNFEDESFNETSPRQDAIFDDEEPVCPTMVIPEFSIIPPTPKSPRVSKNKNKTELENSVLEETIVDDEENKFTKSLRSRTIVGNLTPRSARKLKESANSSHRGRSPRMKKDNSILQDDKPEENTKVLDFNESLNQSLRSSKRTQKSPRTGKSPRIGKSPRQKPKRQAPHPSSDQEIREEESPNKERNVSISSPKQTSSSGRRSLRQKEETKNIEKQDLYGDQSQNGSPVIRFVKNAARRTSLLYNMIKSPKSASKKAKEISKALEEMQIDSEIESKKTDNPVKSGQSLLKRVKTPKQGNKSKVEEEISKEFQKMQVDENVKSEKKSALANLFATPNKLSRRKSPRQRRKSAKGANKSSVDEQMEFDSSMSTADRSIQVNGEEQRENPAKENLTDSLEVQNNPLKRRISRNHDNNINILNEKDTNYEVSKELDQSLKESKIPERRKSLRIPENDVRVDKENETPGKIRKTLNRQYSTNVESPKISPKPSETPSKRKSIKRSMSCHMEECTLDAASASQLQRSKSSGLLKTPAVRRTLNLMSFDTP